MRRTSIGYVFQDFNLIPALTAAENVALPRELDGQGRRAARQAARAALEEVGIGDLADRFPDEMSGGQQQRVAIARAIVGERRLILADEPTGALDSETGEDILRLLRGRCDAGAAGVLVTHEARHAAWADRVVFLRDGVVVDESGADRPDSPAGALAMTPPSGIAGWRLALRLAWREAWRAKGRSALVLVMVTFPVIAVVAADVAQATSSVSSVEGLDRRIGSAQALVTACPTTPAGLPDRRPRHRRPDDHDRAASGPPSPGPSSSRRSGASRPAIELRTRQAAVRTDARAARRRRDRRRPGEPAGEGLFRLTSGRAAHGRRTRSRSTPRWPRTAFASAMTCRSRTARRRACGRHRGVHRGPDPAAARRTGRRGCPRHRRTACGSGWSGGAPVTWDEVRAAQRARRRRCSRGR